MKKLLRRKKKNESYFKYIMSVSHLWLGLLSSIIVMVVCLSGCLYAFKQQIEDFANRETVYVSETSGERVAIDSIIKTFESKHGKFTRIVIPEKERGRSIQLSAGERNSAITACYNPYTGKFIGLKRNATQEFFSTILDLHRNLMMGPVGKTIVGISVLVFIFMLISGLVLWFPVKRNQIKSAFGVKWKAKFYRLNYDLHNVLGFYSMVLLLFIALTGAYVSFHWVKNGIIVSLGGESIVVSDDNSNLKADLANSFNSLLNSVMTTKPVKQVSIQEIIRKVDSIYTNDGTAAISISNDELKLISVTKYDRSNWLNFYVPNQVEFNREGDVVKEKRYASLPLHKKFIAVAKPLHTGEIMGLGSIIVYFIAALIGASLPVTGFIIWWKKR